MKFSEVQFGDCPHCNYSHLQLPVVWSKRLVDAITRDGRPWAAIACPRCGGVTCLELTIQSDILTSKGSDIPLYADVQVVARYPEGDATRTRISHLPESIATYFANAQRVLAAGVPSAAAVELRRTLEAAAQHFVPGSKEFLVKQIEKLISAGLVTRQFAEALTYVRKIGNVGAHAGETALSERELQASIKFTELLLRNLFEVPGELASIQGDGEAEQ